MHAQGGHRSRQLTIYLNADGPIRVVGYVTGKLLMVPEQLFRIRRRKALGLDANQFIEVSLLIRTNDSFYGLTVSIRTGNQHLFLIHADNLLLPTDNTGSSSLRLLPVCI
ncbi:hypothetical protein D3C76_1358490 [compost metagenome]